MKPHAGNTLFGNYEWFATVLAGLTLNFGLLLFTTLAFCYKTSPTGYHLWLNVDPSSYLQEMILDATLISLYKKTVFFSSSSVLVRDRELTNCNP